jgi:hypothetical protein
MRDGNQQQQATTKPALSFMNLTSTLNHNLNNLIQNKSDHDKRVGGALKQIGEGFRNLITNLLKKGE